MTTARKKSPSPKNVLSNSTIPSTEANEGTEAQKIGFYAPNDVETEVQTHKKKSLSLIDRAKNKMKELAPDDDDDDPKEKKSKSAPGYIRPQQREELATLVSGVLIMLITASDVPDEVAPDTDEINGVSVHLIKILARHVDLSKSLTGDVLDIIGIIAICSGWYARVAPAISQLRKQQTKKKKDPAPGRFVPEPIVEEDPKIAVSNFLNVAALSGGEGPVEQ